MASYGSFITACGFSFHGPQGRIGFKPVIRPDNFSAAFTTAEGWGFYTQKRSSTAFHAAYRLDYGKLMITGIQVSPGNDLRHPLKLVINDRILQASIQRHPDHTLIILEKPLIMHAGDLLKINLGG
jgi:hypothetical protein